VLQFTRMNATYPKVKLHYFLHFWNVLPFNPNFAPRQGHSMYNETLNTAESLIKRTWHLRRVAPLPYAYPARAYASNEQPAQFKRAIDTAQKIARDIKMYYGDGTDFVFHSISGILAERSYGYLEIKEPEKTLEMKDEIKRQIAVEGILNLNCYKKYAT